MQLLAVVSYSYSSLYMLYILQNGQRNTTSMQYTKIIFSNSLSDFFVFIFSLHCSYKWIMMIVTKMTINARVLRSIHVT
jgi:hypothetical protein